MTDSSEVPQTGRTVTVMLAGGLPPPAFIEIKNENGDIIQRYTPSGLDDEQWAMTAELVKAVKLCLLCFHVHWPSNPPLRDTKPEVVGRLKAVVAKAETLLGKKVDYPPPPRLVPAAKAAALEKGKQVGRDD